MDGCRPFAISKEALAEVCTRYRVHELAMFGSGARNELRPDSDIDLLVVFDERAVVTLFTLFDLQAELAGLFGRRVDLIPKNGLKPAARKGILADARVLYAA